MRSQLYVCLLLCLSTGEALTLSMRSPRLFSTAAGTPRCWPVAAAKKGGKKKAKKSPPASGGGFGSTAKAAAPTPAERLKKSMELYEQLLKGRGATAEEDEDGNVSASGGGEDAEDVLVKYTLTLRSTEASSPAEFSDWVPIALTNLVCGVDTNPKALMPDVVGALCREVYEAGAQAYPVLRKAAPQSIEYAFETADSFEQHVYEGLLGRPERRAEAAKTLGIEVGASPGEVKKAHRGFMKTLHPDMFVGDEAGKRSGWNVPPTRSEDSGPSASLDHLKAQTAPTTRSAA